MRLRAKVRRITGKAIHGSGGIIDGKHVITEPFPPTAWVEIVPDLPTRAFSLLYYDKADRQMTDTWHETLAAAKQRAHLEFEIDDDDWVDVDQN